VIQSRRGKRRPHDRLSDSNSGRQKGGRERNVSLGELSWSDEVAALPHSLQRKKEGRGGEDDPARVPERKRRRGS